jgi:hypothetical protein
VALTPGRASLAWFASDTSDTMSDSRMMLLGFIWAAAAPLSLVVLVAVVAALLRRGSTRARVLVAALLVLAPVAVIWRIDHAEFEAVCNGEGKPVIFAKDSADGIFLNSGTANSFGMRYLQEEGFAWVEAPSIYHRGSWVRYQRDTASQGQGAIQSIEIPAITARIEVREEFSTPLAHTGLAQTKIVDRQSGRLLAQAGSASFSGGRMRWVLGAWGASSCPSAMRSPTDFTEYYHLAKRTLR